MPATRTGSVTRLARAKINLALHVTDQRGDGFHEIDTLVGFAETGDRLSVAPASSITLSLSGPFGRELVPAGEDNLVMRAARLLQEAAAAAGHSADGAQLALEKNLPVASGIGGGSADAAAALAALAEVWGLPANFDLRSFAEKLGSDVAMCLASRPLHARGRGEKIEELSDARPRPILLVNPGVGLSTPDVFGALTTKNNAPISAPAGDPFDPDYLAGLRNDLQAPATKLVPVVGDVIETISSQPGCRLARMSGSGATCFGVFDNAQSAQLARQQIVDIEPGWWSALSEIGGSPKPN